jgi:hypothetical protein
MRYKTAHYILNKYLKLYKQKQYLTFMPLFALFAVKLAFFTGNLEPELSEVPRHFGGAPLGFKQQY